MSNPNSAGIQGATFYENDNTALIWAVADQLTQDGKTDPATAAAFPPEVAPVFRYKIGLGYGVDPSDVEQFVQAWIRAANAQRLTFTTSLAIRAMQAAGLNVGRATLVARAMGRLQSVGKLPYLAQNPSGWVAENPGLDPLASISFFIKMVPWLLGGALVFVALPYLKAARAPAAALGGR